MSSRSTPRRDRVLEKRRPSTESPKGINTGISLKIKESALELQIFLLEWNKLHLSGSVILDSIKTLKLESFRNCEERSYPQGLQERCDHLQSVVDKMESHLAQLEILVTQFSALVKLNALQGSNTEAVFLSWSIEKYSQAFQNIYEKYSKEFLLKKVIKEDVGHSINKEELIYFVTSWALQPFIEYTCQLLCESLLVETGLR